MERVGVVWKTLPALPGTLSSVPMEMRMGYVSTTPTWTKMLNTVKDMREIENFEVQVSLKGCVYGNTRVKPWSSFFTRMHVHSHPATVLQVHTCIPRAVRTESPSAPPWWSTEWGAHRRWRWDWRSPWWKGNELPLQGWHFPGTS